MKKTIKETRGRHTKYKEKYAEQVYKLCLLGAIDKDLADFFEISESTLNLWKKEYPLFSESLKKGKIVADIEVADALYHRALGYTHAEDKVFLHEGSPVIVPTNKHYPPDTISLIFWLKNRQPTLWSDKKEVNAAINLEVRKIDKETIESVKQIFDDITE